MAVLLSGTQPASLGAAAAPLEADFTAAPQPGDAAYPSLAAPSAPPTRRPPSAGRRFAAAAVARGHGGHGNAVVEPGARTHRSSKEAWQPP